MWDNYVLIQHDSSTAPGYTKSFKLSLCERTDGDADGVMLRVSVDGEGSY